MRRAHGWFPCLLKLFGRNKHRLLTAGLNGLLDVRYFIKSADLPCGVYGVGSFCLKTLDLFKGPTALIPGELVFLLNPSKPIRSIFWFILFWISVTKIYPQHVFSLFPADQMFYLRNRKRVLWYGPPRLWNTHTAGAQPGQLSVSLWTRNSPDARSDLFNSLPACLFSWP